MQTTTICIANNLELAKMDLQTNLRAITNWFFENYMILNSEKCHYKNCADDKFIHSGTKFKNSSKEETILGVIIDNKLTCDSHVNRICKKVLCTFTNISFY